MKNAFVDQNGILVAYGGIASHGQDRQIAVASNFDKAPGEWAWDGSKWVKIDDQK